MRLFAAVDIPQEVVDRLDRLISKWRPLADLRWSRAGNLHITTKFIGEWPQERLEEMIACLRRIPMRDPIPVAVRGLGWFPHERSPRVLWAGVEAPPSLHELAAATVLACENLGIAAEKRPFSPHLTLARIDPGSRLEKLREAIAALDTRDFGNFRADRFFLYESKLRPGGSVYTKLAEFAA